jgi:autotransporter-associated beta strand protein
LASGAAGFAKSGSGTTTLSGTNAYTGTTTVSGGVLKIGSTTALGSGNLVLDGGVLGLAAGNFSRTEGAGVGEFQWAGHGGFAAYGADRSVSPGTLSWGSVSLSGNTLILGAADADAAVVWTSNISFAGGSRTIHVNNGTGTVDARISGVLSGDGAFIKTGDGTLVLSNGSNSFLADTVINGGTLQLGNGGTTGDLGATGSITVNSGTLAVNRSNAFTQASDLHGKIISGAGSFVQAGSGTTTLSLANTYSGNTTVSSGTLVLGSVNPNNQSSTVTIGASGILRLTFTGTDTVGKIFIAGIQRPAGIYGHTSSGATNGGFGVGAFDAWFATGTGTLTVTSGPPGPITYAVWKAANAGSQGPELDWDKDGVRNGVEYFMNSPAGLTQNPSLNAARTITWSNGGNLPASTYGSQFVVQTSNNLGNWTDVPIASLTSNTNGPGGALTYTLTGNAPRFVRLKITPN